MDISQEQQEEVLARLNQACLHAEMHGDRPTRVEYNAQITQLRQWFREHGICTYVQGNGYALSPLPDKSTVSVARHRVVADEEIVYEGDDTHAACCVLLDYARDTRPKHVLYEILRQVVPVGTDPQTLTWDWTIQGADHANAAEGEAR